jgi:dihydrofolate reductase
MNYALVVASSPEGIIGRDGAIPWHLPTDLKRFRAITWDHPILMGRRTYESIGRALPGRLNLVISQTLKPLTNGCVVARSPGEAVAIARASGAVEAMIVGGEALYRQFLPECDVLHLTIVEGSFDGDARFPIESLRAADWLVEHRESWPSDERHAFAHRYERLRRVRDPRE